MRARNIKPGICKNDELAECSPHARLLFIYMWMLADREGRLENRPKRIRAECFPYEPDVNVEKLLEELQPFLDMYGDDRGKYIHIINFTKHQNPHRNEKESVIPAPECCETAQKVHKNNMMHHVAPIVTPVTTIALGAACDAQHDADSDSENENEKKISKNRMLHVVPEITGQVQEKHKTTRADSHDSLIPDSLKEEKSLCVKSDDLTHQYGDDVVEFVTQYQGYAVNHLGNRAPKVTTVLIKNGCDTIDKLIRLDGHDLNQIRAVLRWAVQDEFWCDQIYSLASLRRAKDGLTKFQKILAACEKSCRQSITGGDVLRAMAQKGGCDGEQQGTDVYQAEIGGSGGYETAGYTNTNGNDQGAGPVVQNPDTEARRAALASW